MSWLVAVAAAKVEVAAVALVVLEPAPDLVLQAEPNTRLLLVAVGMDKPHQDKAAMDQTQYSVPLPPLGVAVAAAVLHRAMLD